jgi:hypothetical protein
MDGAEVRCREPEGALVRGPEVLDFPAERRDGDGRANGGFGGRATPQHLASDVRRQVCGIY